MKNKERDIAMNLFRFASLQMQNYIIGYIKVGSRYEPAISDFETFMPLSSFGISNVHISSKFVRFPEGKTLAEMLERPIEFQEWCKLNLI